MAYTHPKPEPDPNPSSPCLRMNQVQFQVKPENKIPLIQGKNENWEMVWTGQLYFVLVQLELKHQPENRICLFFIELYRQKWYPGTSKTMTYSIADSYYTWMRVPPPAFSLENEVFWHFNVVHPWRRKAVKGIPFLPKPRFSFQMATIISWQPVIPVPARRNYYPVYRKKLLCNHFIHWIWINSWCM